MEHEIKFGTLHPDGTLTNEREIQHNDIEACPHLILVPGSTSETTARANATTPKSKP